MKTMITEVFRMFFVSVQDRRRNISLLSVLLEQYNRWEATLYVKVGGNLFLTKWMPWEKMRKYLLFYLSKVIWALPHTALGSRASALHFTIPHHNGTPHSSTTYIKCCLIWSLRIGNKFYPWEKVLVKLMKPKFLFWDYTVFTVTYKLINNFK